MLDEAPQRGRVGAVGALAGLEGVRVTCVHHWLVASGFGALPATCKLCGAERTFNASHAVDDYLGIRTTVSAHAKAWSAEDSKRAAASRRKGGVVGGKASQRLAAAGRQQKRGSDNTRG